MVSILARAFSREAMTSGAGAGADMAGMAPPLEAGAAVLAAGGTVFITFAARKLWNRFRGSGKEGREPAVPTESVESIFRVLADDRHQVANDRLYDALDELEDVYSPDEIDTRLNEAVTEWSKSRPEGAGNPPGRPEMVRVLRVVIQEFQESKYRVQFAAHYRELNSIERGYRSDIEGVFIGLEAEGPADRGNRRPG